MDETENAEIVETSSPDREASPTGELGEHIHKGVVHVMWGGVWVPLGDAEFLTRNGEIIKVISVTPRVNREGP